MKLISLDDLPVQKRYIIDEQGHISVIHTTTIQSQTKTNIKTANKTLEELGYNEYASSTNTINYVKQTKAGSVFLKIFPSIREVGKLSIPTWQTEATEDRLNFDEILACAQLIKEIEKETK